MKIHAAIDRAHQHGLLSERWMIKRKLPLRIGLGACNRLHASLKLDEENLHACGGWARGALLYFSPPRARARGFPPGADSGHPGKEKKKTQSHPDPPPARAL